MFELFKIANQWILFSPWNNRRVKIIVICIFLHNLTMNAKYFGKRLSFYEIKLEPGLGDWINVKTLVFWIWLQSFLKKLFLRQ